MPWQEEQPQHLHQQHQHSPNAPLLPTSGSSASLTTAAKPARSNGIMRSTSSKALQRLGNRQSPVSWRAGKGSRGGPGSLSQQLLGSKGTASLLRLALPLLLVAAISSLGTYHLMHRRGMQHMGQGGGAADGSGHPLDVAAGARQGGLDGEEDMQSILDAADAVDDPGRGGSRRGTAAAEAVAADALAAVAAERRRQRQQQLLEQRRDRRAAGQRAPGTSLEAIRALEDHLAHVITEQHLFGADDGPQLPHHFGLPGPGRPTVALVNHAPYHLEVVAGLLHLFKDWPCKLLWYQAGQALPGDRAYTAAELLQVVGFVDLVGGLPDGLLRNTSQPPEPCDFAVFVSPEYFVHDTQAFLQQAAPLSALMLVHNGNNPNIVRLAKLHPKLHFAALSPHVAAHARGFLHVHTHWLLATWPYIPKHRCSPAVSPPPGCLHGFSIQGNFEPPRRNYSRVWQQIEAHRAKGLLPRPPRKPLHLHLLGKGRREDLRLHSSLAGLTTVHFNLPFPDYYEEIHHTHALLLVLGAKFYLQYKISSTTVSSLMTGVPIIADGAVLKAYTYLTPDHVFLMRPGEDEVDTMLRVLRMPAEALDKKRRNVAALANHLNARTRQLIQTFMPQPGEVAAAAAARKAVTPKQQVADGSMVGQEAQATAAGGTPHGDAAAGTKDAAAGQAAAAKTAPAQAADQTSEAHSAANAQPDAANAGDAAVRQAPSPRVAVVLPRLAYEVQQDEGGEHVHARTQQRAREVAEHAAREAARMEAADAAAGRKPGA